MVTYKYANHAYQYLQAALKKTDKNSKVSL